MKLQQFLSKFDKKHTHYDLTEAIPGDTRIFDPTKRIAGSVISEGFEDAGIGVIKMPFPVLTLVGREQLNHIYNGKLKSVDPTNLPKNKACNVEMTTEIHVPYCTGYKVSSTANVMMPIPAKANRILQTLQGEEIDSTKLQQNVWDYYEELTRLLSGQGGLIRGELYETRMRQSMRAVCVPDTRLEFNQVGISKKYRRLLNNIPEEYEKAYCLVDREPNLWLGSVQVLEIVVFDEDFDAILLNPHSHTPLNADFDGDCVSLVVPPHNAKTYAEFQRYCGRSVIEFHEWKEEFKLCSTETDPQAYFDSKFRFTLTPKELLDTSGDYFDRCRETGAKRIPEDFAEYAAGRGVDSFCDVAEETALQLTRMKREIGLVGALTDKINQLLFAYAPEKLPEGFRLKEKITQLLLDSKSGTDAFDSRELFDIFNFRGKYTENGREEFLECLREQQFDDDMIKWIDDILDTLWDYLPLNMGIAKVLPQYQVSRSNDLSALVTTAFLGTSSTCVVDKVMDYMLETKS